MSFQFEWPEFSEAFYEDAREMLAQVRPPLAQSAGSGDEGVVSSELGELTCLMVSLGRRRRSTKARNRPLSQTGSKSRN